MWHFCSQVLFFLVKLLIGLEWEKAKFNGHLERARDGLLNLLRAYLFHVIEYVRLYLCKWLKLENQWWISKKWPSNALTFDEIEPREMGNRCPALTYQLNALERQGPYISIFHIIHSSPLLKSFDGVHSL